MRRTVLVAVVVAIAIAMGCSGNSSAPADPSGDAGAPANGACRDEGSRCTPPSPGNVDCGAFCGAQRHPDGTNPCVGYAISCATGTPRCIASTGIRAGERCIRDGTPGLCDETDTCVPCGACTTCGALNACGELCKTGSCPNGETCNDGVCQGQPSPTPKDAGATDSGSTCTNLSPCVQSGVTTNVTYPPFCASSPLGTTEVGISVKNTCNRKVYCGVVGWQPSSNAPKGYTAVELQPGEERPALLHWCSTTANLAGSTWKCSAPGEPNECWEPF